MLHGRIPSEQTSCSRKEVSNLTLLSGSEMYVHTCMDTRRETEEDCEYNKSSGDLDGGYPGILCSTFETFL